MVLRPVFEGTNCISYSKSKVSAPCTSPVVDPCQVVLASVSKMLIQWLLEAPQRKGDVLSEHHWSPWTQVNGGIKVYKSNLFLNSLISGYKQGLSVFNLPAKVNPFSLSAESKGATRDKRVCLQIWFCKERPLVSRDMIRDRNAPGSQHSFDQASALPWFQTLFPPSSSPETDNPVLGTWQHASLCYKAMSTRSKEGQRPIHHSSEHMVDVYHCRHIESYGHDGI